MSQLKTKFIANNAVTAAKLGSASATSIQVPFADGAGNVAFRSIALTDLPALTGYVAGAGTVSATDSIISAIQKIDGNTNAKFTLPSLSAGSILFSDGTTIVQDNANFFWDASNKALSIGPGPRPATSADLAISTQSGATKVALSVFSTSTNNAIQIQNQTAYALQALTASNSTGPAIGFERARGTLASKLQVLAGDILGSFSFGGYTGSADGALAAGFGAVATENVTSGAAGAQLIFQTTANGTTSLVTRLVIGQDGKVQITSLAASSAIVTDASSNLVASATTAAQIGYLSAVTSDVQAQLNAKQASGNYITSLTGEASASGPGAATVTLSNAAVIAKVLTGFTAGAGTVSATDSILSAFQKVVGNLATYLPLAGGTMTGQIVSQNIIPAANATYNLGASGNNYAAGYFNTVNLGTVNKGAAGAMVIQTSNLASGITIQTIAGDIKLNPSTANIDASSAAISNVLDPTSPQQVATKHYVDNLIAGLSWKNEVRAASTANVSVSSAPSTIDSLTLLSGDRVLLKDQTTQSENGIYVFNGAAAALTRATDMVTWAEVVGSVVLVTEGAVNTGSKWVNNNVAGGTIGTTAITFVAFSVAGTVNGTGTSGYVAYWNGTSTLTAEQYLSTSRGGLGASAAAFTGVLKFSSGVASASQIVNADVAAGAAIAYSKLALTASILAADMNSGAAANGTVATANGSGGVTYAALPASATGLTETFALNSTNITNQYIDLGFVASGSSSTVNSVSVAAAGGGVQIKGTDYSVSLTGGAGGVTRITFLNGLATGGVSALDTTDTLIVSYTH